MLQKEKIRRHILWQYHCISTRRFCCLGLVNHREMFYTNKCSAMDSLQSTYSDPVKEFTLFSSDISVTILQLLLHTFPTSDPDIQLVFWKQEHLCMFYVDHLSKQRKIAVVITVEYNLPTSLSKINSIKGFDPRACNFTKK